MSLYCPDHTMPLCRLNASTHIKLHPEFLKDPVMFALRYKLELVGDVSPETSFKKDGDTGEKTANIKANIHLNQRGAIRLFTERDGDVDWIRSIDLIPSLLLHGNEGHPLAEADLAESLSLLQTAVMPLCADPLDACHIIPGLVSDGKHVAYWRSIESDVLLTDVDLRCLHGISHPHTGPAEGSTKDFIQLGDNHDACVIRFENLACETTKSGGRHKSPGVRVRLRLKGPMLLNTFGRTGTTAFINNTDRLVAFRSHDVARVHQSVMSRTEGFYLPVPPEWTDMGKAVTHAKVMALLSALTPIPLDELQAMYEAQSSPSNSTRKRLNNDVSAAVDCLKRVPVSSLFSSEVYATRQAERISQSESVVDPLVAATYGAIARCS